MKTIFAISGSTRKDSTNLHILRTVALMYKEELNFVVFNGLDQLPHFNPDLDTEPAPAAITAFRNGLTAADGVLICTPEYVFSLPGALKNAIEWTVSTTIFTNKPTALITASSSGTKAHEALQLLMSTLGAKTSADTSLLIQAPKTKVDAEGRITDAATLQHLHQLMERFTGMLSIPA